MQIPPHINLLRALIAKTLFAPRKKNKSSPFASLPLNRSTLFLFSFFLVFLTLSRCFFLWFPPPSFFPSSVHSQREKYWSGAPVKPFFFNSSLMANNPGDCMWDSGSFNTPPPSLGRLPLLIPLLLHQYSLFRLFLCCWFAFLLFYCSPISLSAVLSLLPP